MGSRSANQTSFKKGGVPWIKGRRHRPESIARMSAVHKKLCATSGIWSTGKKRTAEHCRNLSISLKGRIAWNKGLKGFRSGPRIADRSKLARRDERNDSAYGDWRMQVWRRDNFKCRFTGGNCNGRIEAHHILRWSDYPELRYEVKN